MVAFLDQKIGLTSFTLKKFSGKNSCRHGYANSFSFWMMIQPRKLTFFPWKMMVGWWISFWNGPFFSGHVDFPGCTPLLKRMVKKTVNSHGDYFLRTSGRCPIIMEEHRHDVQEYAYNNEGNVEYCFNRTRYISTWRCLPSNSSNQDYKLKFHFQICSMGKKSILWFVSFWSQKWFVESLTFFSKNRKT